MPLALEAVARLSVLVFVVSSMLALGLTYSVEQMLGPLADVRLVAKVVVANFVLVPLLAAVALFAIPLSEPLAVGLLLLATAAGAPFLPKLVEVAGGDVAFGVGTMILLMVTTVVYVPLVLPLLLVGVRVNPLDIAGSLVVLMLVPLAVGLAVGSRYPSVADAARPPLRQATNVALILLTVLVLVLNFDNIAGIVGSGAVVVLVAFVLLSVGVGYALGGPAAETRTVSALGTGQRNVSAALVVGAQNFPDPDVLVMVVVGSVVMLVLLMTLAGEAGRRTERTGVNEPRASENSSGEKPASDDEPHHASGNEPL